MKNSIKSFSKARSRSSFKNKQILSKANEIFFVTEDNFEDFKFLNEDPFKLNLEIGFGDGKYLFEQALNNPKQSFIGIEVFESGLANTYKKIEKLNITNLKLIQGDVSEIFSKNKSKNLFDLITIFFPDPWPKSKHKKRRLLKKNFFLILKSLLKKEGKIINSPRGKGGFGYDPIFQIKNSKLTLAEISEEKRMKISHRTISTLKMINLLNESKM